MKRRVFDRSPFKLVKLTANLEHKIANLKFISPFSFDFCAQSEAGIVAPCENPSIPSNGPDCENMVLRYESDSSKPSVWFWC
ncbi:hypothetical protein LguiA_023563 [Lonicera macranthoides]